PGDGEARANGERALGNSLLGRFERPLCALCHHVPGAGSDRPAGPTGPGIEGQTAYPGGLGEGRFGGHDPTSRGSHGQDDARMSTLTLILLAAITGLAILAASAIQILLAR